MPLTTQEINQIAEATALAMREGHTCRFNQDEAEVLHGFGRAMKAHTAGEREIFIVIQLGKNLADIGKKIGTAILWTIIIGAAAFLLSGILPWKFWK
jgi:hypothetical protein